MSHRKTIAVEQIRDWVNTRLQVANSSLMVKELTPEQAFRLGAASLLEQILHATGNYKGFGYTNLGDEGYVHGETDETRRCYY